MEAVRMADEIIAGRDTRVKYEHDLPVLHEHDPPVLLESLPPLRGFMDDSPLRDVESVASRMANDTLSTLSDVDRPAMNEIEAGEYEVKDEDEEEGGGGEGLDPESLNPMPAVEEPLRPVSFTNRLVGMFRAFADRAAAVRGLRLTQHCSLSRSEDNTDLQWDKVLGSGRYGRVSLVMHELGSFAIKELTDVSFLLLVLFCVTSAYCCVAS